jgi:hypothetical protein
MNCYVANFLKIKIDKKFKILEYNLHKKIENISLLFSERLEELESEMRPKIQ